MDQNWLCHVTAWTRSSCVLCLAPEYWHIRDVSHEIVTVVTNPGEESPNTAYIFGLKVHKFIVLGQSYQLGFFPQQAAESI